MDSPKKLSVSLLHHALTIETAPQMKYYRLLFFGFPCSHLHQPFAEQACVIGVKTVGDRDYKLQTIYFHACTVIDTDTSAHLIVIQRVCFQNTTDSTVYRCRCNIEQFGNLRRTHPNILSGCADFLSCYFYNIPFHIRTFRECRLHTRLYC